MNSQEEIASFVSSLELEETEIKFSQLETLKALKDPTEGNDGNESAYVVGGSIVSFVSGLKQADQSDILNSTLLAQLASNKKYDPEKQTKEWYNFYRYVLIEIGWAAQEFHFDNYEISGSSSEIDTIILEVMAGIATQNELIVVKAALDALKRLPSSDNRVVLWDSQSHKENGGNFQIALGVDSGGVIATRIGCFTFDTKTNITNVLWFTFSSGNSHIHKAGQTIYLDKNVYSQVRADIIKKLGEKAKTFVQDLDI